VVVNLASIEERKVVVQLVVNWSVPHEVEVVEVFSVARLGTFDPIIEKLLSETNSGHCYYDRV
jgi:hypothetical protein